MHEEIGAYEAKTKLPEILRRVESGNTFTITNRGKAIADLVPSKAISREKTKLAVANLQKMPKVKLSDKDLKELIQAGRK